MEQKQVNIIPPKGYEVDKENSTFECIKFKPIKSWRDSNPIIYGYWLVGNTSKPCPSSVCWKSNLDTFATEKQAKSALAMAQISQIMANDKRFGGAITYEEWINPTMKYVIERRNNKLSYNNVYSLYYFLAFHTSEQRDLFIKENEDLVKDYLMIG